MDGWMDGIKLCCQFLTAFTLLIAVKWQCIMHMKSPRSEGWPRWSVRMILASGHTRIHNSNRSLLHSEASNIFLCCQFCAQQFEALPLHPNTARVTLALWVNLDCVLSINNVIYHPVSLLPLPLMYICLVFWRALFLLSLKKCWCTFDSCSFLHVKYYKIV